MSDILDKDFISQLSQCGYSYYSAKRVYDKYLNGRKSNIKLNAQHFPIKKQARMPLNLQLFENMILLLNEKYATITHTKIYSKSELFVIATLFALYSGLRSFELYQINKNILKQLKSKDAIISLIRKYNGVWHPIYHKKFKTFIDELVLDFFPNSWPFTLNSLLLFIKKLYILANPGEAPPLGLGIHSFRYYVASKLQKKNIGLSQQYLGHAKASTTEKYIKTVFYKDKVNTLINKDPIFIDILDTIPTT